MVVPGGTTAAASCVTERISATVSSVTVSDTTSLTLPFESRNCTYTVRRPSPVASVKAAEPAIGRQGSADRSIVSPMRNADVPPGAVRETVTFRLFTKSLPFAMATE